MANWIHERVANGEFITYEVDQAFTRETITVDNATGDVEPGTVVADVTGKLVGINVNRVKAGRPGRVAAIVRGPAIVILDLLRFPFVTDAPDGPDAGSDNRAENAAATAALKADLLAQLAAKNIIARN